jgi:YD repeat-containing protein
MKNRILFGILASFAIIIIVLLSLIVIKNNAVVGRAQHTLLDDSEKGGRIEFPKESSVEKNDKIKDSKFDQTKRNESSIKTLSKDYKLEDETEKNETIIEKDGTKTLVKYKYDDEGNLRERTRINEEGHSSYEKFDDEGNLIEEKYFDPEDEILYTIRYYKNGNVKEEEIDYLDGNKRIVRYDENKNVVEIEFVKPDGKRDIIRVKEI